MRAERGAVLLEVLAALLLIGVAGMAMLRTLAVAGQREHAAFSEERLVGAADRLLTAHVLLTRTDLDRRLGQREAGEFTVTVQRPEPSLYRIAVVERAYPELELLATVVYRPEHEP